MTDRRRKEGREIGERGAQPYEREERNIYEVMRNKENSRENGWEKEHEANENTREGARGRIEGRREQECKREMS